MFVTLSNFMLMHGLWCLDRASLSVAAPFFRQQEQMAQRQQTDNSSQFPKERKKREKGKVPHYSCGLLMGL